jgi:lipoprotein-anchoring transpeptidase ErfK/SrfK
LKFSSHDSSRLALAIAMSLALAHSAGAALTPPSVAPSPVAAPPAVAPSPVAMPSALMPLATPLDAATTEAESVLHAQVLLDRAHFSPGEIDGLSGSNLRRALTGYQASRDLPASGTLDAATWAALSADSAPALVEHTILAADVAGPFATIPTDMMEKSKLSALGYGSALEALAEQFHASPALLSKLNPGKDLTRVGETMRVPNVLGTAPPPTAASVLVDRSDSTVALLDAAGKTIALFPASTGSKHDPLPVGAWKVQGVARDPVFHYNPKLFWDADPTHAKAKIPAGPNNPVGVVWVDLSKEHYGIHGTPEPSRIGKSQSHGCIRLTNWTAQLLAQAVTPGMPALLQE